LKNITVFFAVCNQRCKYVLFVCHKGAKVSENSKVERQNFKVEN
jgi:hypothetical protein